MNSAFSVSFLCLSLLLLRWLVRVLNYRKRLPLPPGPKGYLIIGNLLDVPKVMPWKAFGEWAKKYGEPFPSFSYHLPSQPTLDV